MYSTGQSAKTTIFRTIQYNYWNYENCIASLSLDTALIVLISLFDSGCSRVTNDDGTRQATKPAKPVDTDPAGDDNGGKNLKTKGEQRGGKSRKLLTCDALKKFVDIPEQKLSSENGTMSTCMYILVYNRVL